MASTIQNDPTKAGQAASASEFFGPIEVVAIHSRVIAGMPESDAVCWFVKDHNQLDRFGIAEVVGQKATRAEAVARALDLWAMYSEIAAEVGSGFVANGGDPADAGVAVAAYFADMNDR